MCACVDGDALISLLLSKTSCIDIPTVKDLAPGLVHEKTRKVVEFLLQTTWDGREDPSGVWEGCLFQQVEEKEKISSFFSRWGDNLLISRRGECESSNVIAHKVSLEIPLPTLKILEFPVSSIAPRAITVSLAFHQNEYFWRQVMNRFLPPQSERPGRKN